MNSTINEVIKSLLLQIKSAYKESGKLTDEHLSALQYIFQKPLSDALDLVDRGQVTHVASSSGRDFYQVRGNSGNGYICLKSSNYCSCPAYTFSVLKKMEYPMCKHQLACILCDSMGLLKEVEYSDETVALMISGIE